VGKAKAGYQRNFLTPAESFYEITRSKPLNLTLNESACTIPGGRASRRAESPGSDGASPSRDHERSFSDLS
jgi:hypothetical protein